MPLDAQRSSAPRHSRVGAVARWRRAGHRARNTARSRRACLTAMTKKTSCVNGESIMGDYHELIIAVSSPRVGAQVLHHWGSGNVRLFGTSPATAPHTCGGVCSVVLCGCRYLL